MSGQIETVLSVAVTICAILVTSVVVYDRLFATSVVTIDAEPQYVDGWEDILLTGGDRVGDAAVPLEIVEFGDFQCPFCRVFHESVRSVMEQYPNQVALTYYHYPLEIHPQATSAAYAATCASESGAFWPMADALYSQQESLGAMDWSQYAMTAGITDSVRFADCMREPATADRVSADRALGKELSVSGTPTVIVNGWRYMRPPTRDSLTSLLEAALTSAGR